MFCRSCWANIADGSAECPKCHGDPTRIALGGTARAPVAPPAKTPGDRQNRLIVLLALLVVVLTAAPPAVEWAVRRWRPEPAAAPAVPAPRPGAETVVPNVEPSAPSAGGPEDTLIREAYALYRQGRVAEACDRYREAGRRAQSEEVRRNLGSCLARLGREAYEANVPERAAEHYQRALEAYPETPGVWLALAIALVKARDHGRAQAVLEQAAGRFPDDAEVLFLLAEVQERQGRVREAVAVLRRLLGRHPDHGRGQRLLAALEGEHRLEGGYWSQESRHFVVRYEGAVALDVSRSVTDYAEEAYDAVGRALGHFPADRVQLSIYSQEVLGQVYHVPAHYIRGLFDGKRIRLNLAKSVAASNDLSQLVRHEYTHAVIHEVAAGRAPIWVHEGLAQVMEGRARWPLDISVPRESLTVDGIERLARTMEPNAFTAGYILTHVAMEYVVDRGGMGRVRDFLVRLGRGQSTDEALRAAFGFGADEVEGRLRAVAGVN